MAFRGRGRGAAFENRFVKPSPFILFPVSWTLVDVNLPSVPGFPLPQEEQALITWKVKLEKFLKDSCYNLQETAPKSRKQDTEIERYYDRFKSKAQVKRESLASYLKLTPSNFPAELIQGSKHVQPDNKRLRCGRDSDEQLLEMFEKLEEKNQGQDETEGKAKKGESDDEEEAEEEVEEESSDDGDYNQNIDFDDDEDDLNMEAEADEDIMNRSTS